MQLFLFAEPRCVYDSGCVALCASRKQTRSRSIRFLVKEDEKQTQAVRDQERP